MADNYNPTKVETLAFMVSSFITSFNTFIAFINCLQFIHRFAIVASKIKEVKRKNYVIILRLRIHALISILLLLLSLQVLLLVKVILHFLLQ